MYIYIDPPKPTHWPLFSPARQPIQRQFCVVCISICLRWLRKKRVFSCVTRHRFFVIFFFLFIPAICWPRPLDCISPDRRVACKMWWTEICQRKGFGGAQRSTIQLPTDFSWSEFISQRRYKDSLFCSSAGWEFHSIYMVRTYIVNVYS